MPTHRQGGRGQAGKGARLWQQLPHPLTAPACVTSMWLTWPGAMSAIKLQTNCGLSAIWAPATASVLDVLHAFERRPAAKSPM